MSVNWSQWRKYFFGTPRRFLATVIVPALVFAYFKPEVLERAISNLVGAFCRGIEPFLTPILTMLIVAYGVNRFRKNFWK